MKLFENKVGRPSNEILNKRRNFYIGVVLGIVVFITIGFFALNGFDISNLTGAVRKVDISQKYPYSAGSKIKLSKVKVYMSYKSKFSLTKKTGIYYVSSNKIQNGRISITNNKKYVGNNKKIVGWITESDLLKSRVTNITTTKINDTEVIKKGMLINLSNTKVYKTFLSTKYNKKTGEFYISDVKKINGRIRITNNKKYVGKLNKIVGWISVKDITKIQVEEKDEIIYQKYNVGDVLNLSRDTTGKFSKGFSSTPDKFKYTVVSDDGSESVRVKDYEGETYSILKSNIAGAYNSTTKTYYDSMTEALNDANKKTSVLVYFSDWEDLIVKEDISVVLRPNAWAFNNIINDGSVSLRESVWSNNDVSGEGKFIFIGENASLDLAGPNAIASTGLKFDFDISKEKLSNHRIINVRSKEARENAIMVVEKIVHTSLNDEYTIMYEKCDDETCSIDGTILLIKK